MNDIFDQQTTSKEDRRRTVLAVVLSTIIVSVGFMVQNALFPPSAQQSAQSPAQTSSQEEELPQGRQATPVAIVPVQAKDSVVASTIPIPVEEQKYIVETDVIRATFTNAGGELVSLTLKKHKDMSDSRGGVDMVVPGSEGSEGLSLSFNSSPSPMRELMNAEYLDENKRTIAFSRVFEASVAGSEQKVPFVLKKIFSFNEGEYMFGLAVSIEQPDGRPIVLGSNGIAYRIDLGPQIGPRFDQLPKNADYRKYIAEVNGKKKVENPKANSVTVISPSASWLSMSGKYFAFIAVPKAPISGYEIEVSQDPLIKQTNTLGILRSSFSGASTTDTY
jgi:YidC/Oxa1 family membrane protein insertase